MLRISLPELSQKADTIVHGTVRRMESRWSGDRRRIITDVEIEVTETLKGQAGSTVLLVQPGGRVGDIGQMVHGLPSFTPGEEVVVFLDRHGADAFRVTAMAQGKYQVRRAADSRSVLAVPENTGDLRVQRVRSEVWSRPLVGHPQVPSGIAIAAGSLGFLVGEEEIPLYASGAWFRASPVRGHVLVRTGRGA